MVFAETEDYEETETCCHGPRAVQECGRQRAHQQVLEHAGAGGRGNYRT